MDNFDGTPLQLNDVLHQFGDKDLNYRAVKHEVQTDLLKSNLKRASISIQKLVLRAMFLYVPVYIALLCFGVVKFISLFSLCYLLLYVAIILIFIVINREKSTYK